MSRRSSDVDAWIAAAAARASAAVAELLQGAAPLPLGTGARQIDPDDLAEEVLCPEVWSAAVVSRLKGVASGSAGLLLSDALVRSLLAALVGSRYETPLGERERSALAETGNIAISAAAGAMGRTLGGVVLPSVPLLACGSFEPVLGRMLEASSGARARAYLVDSAWSDPDGGCSLRFVWVADA